MYGLIFFLYGRPTKWHHRSTQLHQQTRERSPLYLSRGLLDPHFCKPNGRAPARRPAHTRIPVTLDEPLEPDPPALSACVPRPLQRAEEEKERASGHNWTTLGRRRVHLKRPDGKGKTFPLFTHSLSLPLPTLEFAEVPTGKTHA